MALCCTGQGAAFEAAKHLYVDLWSAFGEAQCSPSSRWRDAMNKTQRNTLETEELSNKTVLPWTLAQDKSSRHTEIYYIKAAPLLHGPDSLPQGGVQSEESTMHVWSCRKGNMHVTLPSNWAGARAFTGTAVMLTRRNVHCPVSSCKTQTAVACTIGAKYQGSSQLYAVIVFERDYQVAST